MTGEWNFRTASIKLASASFLRELIAMAKPTSPSLLDWVKERLYHLLAPVAALGLVAIFQQMRVAEQLEYLTVSLRFQARAPFDPPADPRLIFVGIDQQSLDRLGAWPWPRNLAADFLETIANSGATPHTLAFDILFTDDYDKFGNLRSTSGANYDDVLGDAAGLLPSIVTGAMSIAPVRDATEQQTAEKRTLLELAQPNLTAALPNVRGDIRKIVGSSVAILPVRPLRKQSLFGFVNDEPSITDGIRHTLPLLIRVTDKVYPSLALQTLCQMLDIDPDKVEVDLPKCLVKLRNSSGKTWTIPVNERGEIVINYRRQENFHNLSFIKLFTALAQHTQKGMAIPPECDIQNKVLLVGGAVTGLTDLGLTPLNARSPLPYTHLNVINNVLRDDYLGFVSWPWVVAGWSLLMWATLLGMRHAPIFYSIYVPMAVVLLYTIFAFAIFWKWSLQIALVWPVLSYGTVNFGAVVLRWREEQHGKQQLKQLFSKMLSPEVMNHLLDHPANLNLGGSSRDVAILFSDIRDYTKISENIGNEELVQQLNNYFERMVACVQENRGTFHKFIGDAVMSVWGDIAAVSLGTEEDARNAVRSALMMRRQLRELNEERQAEGLLPLRIGIGLNHGEVLVGQIGSSSRSEFTVMGDPVNVASRLEGMTKSFHTDLAISESVRLLLGDGFLVRRLGLIQLKGKTRPTVVYEVLAEKTHRHESAWTEEEIARYEKAFDDFLARRFAEAEAGFLACGKKHPEDYCVKRYLEVSREFLINPPPQDWDGRIVMETK
jgi:adenylate cyclase